MIVPVDPLAGVLGLAGVVGPVAAGATRSVAEALSSPGAGSTVPGAGATNTVFT
jgi:hypothetical protein